MRQLGTPGDTPDWVFAYFISSGYGITKDGYHIKYEGMDYDPPIYPKTRSFKTCGRVSDMHHFTDKFWKWLNELDVDLLFFAYPQNLVTNGYDRIKPQGKAVWLPWSVDPEYYYPRKREYDVAVLGSCGTPYPLRLSINHAIVNLCIKNKWKLLKTPRPLYGISPHTPVGSAEKMSIKAYSEKDHILVGDRYAEAMGKSNVILTGTSIYRYPVKRIFEALSSGCVLMTNDPNGSDALGLRDGVNYIRINESNWSKKLKWVLENESEMRKIQDAGRKLALEKHTHEVRVKQMIKEMKKHE